MKQKITLNNSFDIQKESLATMKRVNKAVYDTAVYLRDEARKSFVGSRYTGISSLSEGIMLGKFVKSDSGPSTKIHAFGYDDSLKHLFKTRFFVGGAYHRMTRRGYRGSIESNNAIAKVLDINILNNNIKDALK